jgi:hypothetical protein
MALYDPQEFPAETRTDFSLSEILAWARMKPADEEYRYTDPGNCAVCQFLAETGRASEPRVVLNFWRDGIGSDEHRRFDARISDAANSASLNGSFDGIGTFGGFAKELEELVPA